MNEQILGIHHVTAITSDPQRNIDFYSGVLGLRLVKLTVNFDDPNSYHLYYGDEIGSPGTVLTFFAWPGAARGRAGVPQVVATAFSVPLQAMNFWKERLISNGILDFESLNRFGEEVLVFEDFDGMKIELVLSSPPSAHRPCNQISWSNGTVPAEYAITSFHSVTLAEVEHERTAHFLTEVFGFTAKGTEESRLRYVQRAGSAGGIVDLLPLPNRARGLMSAGVVHHVAFRTTDDTSQKKWREFLVTKGLKVSPVMDRNYFHSIYFLEPGGVLFEIATDGPGFTVDEPRESLGSSLQLPRQYEKLRAQIEAMLPAVRVRGADSK